MPTGARLPVAPGSAIIAATAEVRRPPVGFRRVACSTQTKAARPSRPERERGCLLRGGQGAAVPVRLLGSQAAAGTSWVSLPPRPQNPGMGPTAVARRRLDVHSRSYCFRRCSRSHEGEGSVHGVGELACGPTNPFAEFMYEELAFVGATASFEIWTTEVADIEVPKFSVIELQVHIRRSPTRPRLDVTPRGKQCPHCSILCTGGRNRWGAYAAHVAPE